MTDTPAPRSWTRALAVYGQRHTLVMLALGFAAGLPFLLIFDTLSAWLRQVGLSLDVISFFSLATLAYAFKFLWAPIVDRTRIPVLTRLLGHRRSWMLVVQGFIVLGLTGISLSDPLTHLSTMVSFAVLAGFAGATQDIVIDAWRIEAAPEDEQGAMAAAYQWGYRIAFIVAGAAPLLLADRFDWTVSYGTMGALMIVGVAAVLLAPREKAHTVRPIPRLPGKPQPVLAGAEWILRLAVLVFGALFLGCGLAGKDTLLLQLLPGGAANSFHAAWSAKPAGLILQLAAVLAGFLVILIAALPIPGKPTQPGVFLANALGEPIADFFRRFGRDAWLIVVLICFYRISDFVLVIMNPFYLDLGFTLTQIAAIRKLYGAIMYFAGVFVGGYAIARFGLMRALIAGTVMAPLSNLTFAWLAGVGPSSPALIACLAVNNIALSYAGTCLIAYMSSLTSEGFTATQYALFSSLYALPDKLIMTQSGRIVESAARSADAGGLFAPLKSLMGSLPETSYAASAAKSGFAPASLGAGYVAFFIYACLIGLLVFPVAVIVARRKAQTN